MFEIQLKLEPVCWWRDKVSGSGGLKVGSRDKKVSSQFKEDGGAALQVSSIALFFISITTRGEEWPLDATPTGPSSSLIHLGSVC